MVAAYAVVVLILAVIPTGPALSVGYLDKVAHVCEYLLFAWLLARAIRATPIASSTTLLWAWLYAASYGWLMELIQGMLPWRSADVGDAVADMIGATIGVRLHTIKAGTLLFFAVRGQGEKEKCPDSRK